MTASFPDILYIMGTGRSGSTILEILLSSNKDIFGVGELTHIFQDGFLNDAICACGKPASSCDIWMNVIQKCRWKKESIISLIKLFNRVESHGRFPVMMMNFLPDETIRQYGETNKKLFEAIKEVSGAQVVVDSSKYAGRAAALSRLFPEKVKIICLTRSPAKIIDSFKKPNKEEQKPKSLVAATWYYFYVMTCLWIVCRIMGSRVLHITYEDIADDPAGALKKIESWCGYDLSLSRHGLDRNTWFNVGHIVTGNRLRKKGRIQFQPNISIPGTHGPCTRVTISLMEIYRKIIRF